MTKHTNNGVLTAFAGIAALVLAGLLFVWSFNDDSAHGGEYVFAQSSSSKLTPNWRKKDARFYITKKFSGDHFQAVHLRVQLIKNRGGVGKYDYMVVYKTLDIYNDHTDSKRVVSGPSAAIIFDSKSDARAFSNPIAYVQQTRYQDNHPMPIKLTGKNDVDLQNGKAKYEDYILNKKFIKELSTTQAVQLAKADGAKKLGNKK